MQFLARYHRLFANLLDQLVHVLFLVFTTVPSVLNDVLGNKKIMFHFPPLPPLDI